MKTMLKILISCAVAGSPLLPYAADARPQAAERIEAESIVLTSSSTAISISVRVDSTIRFYIYSITGQLIKTVDVQGGCSESVELGKGCYIVKCSQWSKKVMVR